MSKLTQIEDLKNGKGVRYLLEAAHKILLNPIAMLHPDYSLITYAGSASEDPLWNELISTGSFGLRTQEFFTEEYFTEDAANMDKLVIMRSSKLKHDRIVGYVFNSEHIKVVAIVMVEYDTPFGSEDLAAFEKLEDKITTEIQNDAYFTSYGRAYHEAVINNLLDRPIENLRLYTPHVQILYDGFEEYLYIAVLDAPLNRADKNSPEYYKNMLESEYKSFKYAVYSGYIVMIMSSKHMSFYQDRFFDKLNSLLEQNNLFAGICGSFGSLYKLRKYYDNAVTALKNGIAGGSGKRIFLYDNSI